MDDGDTKLLISPAALKALARMPRQDRDALLDKVEAYAAAPHRPHPAASRLRGHRDLARLRQGDWRGICRLDRADDTVILETVAHRREVYR